MSLSADSPLPRQKRAYTPRSDAYDAWRSAYIPRRFETVRVLSQDSRPGLVLEVDLKRKRALIHIETDDGSYRMWEWLSMLTKNTALYIHPQEFLQSCPRLPGVWTSSSTLYAAYTRYCARRGRSPQAYTRFGMCVRDTGAVPKSSFTVTAGVRRWAKGWVGIAPPAGV